MSSRTETAAGLPQCTIPIEGITDEQAQHKQLPFEIGGMADEGRRPGTPLPRRRRKPRRNKEDRGLPPDDELAKLATAYLEQQQKLWPDLAKAGLLPERQTEIVHKMVDDFKERHRTGHVSVTAVQPFLRKGMPLGGSYSRYSCENSSPNSITDQLINQLKRAKEENRFIPWQYVFADYSVTGLDATRQGYSSYKAVLADKENLIETTYIDDFTRASRDEIEWWKLAALSKRLNKRMIGASDGFDLNSPDWDLKITIYGLLSRLFIKGLREKVKRGMRGAVRRGTVRGSLPLGYTRRERLDPQGNVVVGPTGLPKFEPCIDPATKDAAMLIFELFVVHNWSPYKIAKYCNQHRVDGSNTWSDRSITKLLTNEAFVGVFIWNRWSTVFDYEKNKLVRVKNPRSQWEIHYDRNEALIPMDWWRAARRKLAAARRASPVTGRKLSRNQKSATTLFSGTLHCADCAQELKLVRSNTRDKYRQLGCLNGFRNVHGCTVTGSKSTRIIEECLLGYLQDNILTEDRVITLLGKANAFIEQEAQRPQVDLKPLEAEVKSRQAKIKRLVRRVEETDDEAMANQYERRACELQKELNAFMVTINEAKARNRKALKPLPLERAQGYLADLRQTLNQDVKMAAAAIRELTGPIKIRQEAVPGQQRRTRWIATFSPDLARLLCKIAPNDPSIVAFTDAVDEPVNVEVVIDVGEAKVQKIKSLVSLGMTEAEIANAAGCGTATVSRIKRKLNLASR